MDAVESSDDADAPQAERMQPPPGETSLEEEAPPSPPSGDRFAGGLVHAEKLSVCSKLCYGIGGAPNQAASSASSFFLNIYLLDIALITPFQTSLVLFLGKTCGAITDPFAGYLISESSQTKIGQLMPWLLGSTPFIIVTYFLLWYFPPFTYGRVVWYLTFYCLFQALSILFQVSYSTLTMFLSLDQKDRDSATAYRMAFEVLGTLAGAVLQGSIVASAHTFHHCNQTGLHQNYSSFPDLSHGRKVYMIAAAVIGGMYLVSFTALFFGVKEKIDSCTLKSGQQVPFFKGLRLTVKHGPYVKLTASFLLISTAVQIEQSNFILFCTHAVNLRSHFQNLVLIILLSATVSIPFWQWFLIHFGKKSTACGILWIMPFVVMLAIFPNTVLAYVVAVVSGLSIAVSLLLPWSMLPDVIDHFQVQNPHSSGHETIFYSSYVFFTKLSSGIGLGISAASLDFVGFRSGACEQTRSVVIMLKVLISAVPSVLIFVGLHILSFYPINEKCRSEIKGALEMLRKNHTNVDSLPANEELTSL